jgi:protein involved in polysaccharide export with SLBB domain
MRKFTRTSHSLSGRGLALLPALLLAVFLGTARAQADGADAAAAAAVGPEHFVPGEAMTVEIPLDTNSFLVGGYAIDSSGFAELPVIGRIEVGGRTRADLEEYLSQKLSNYLKDTHVRVLPAIRLSFLGYFTHQGQYYVSPRATVWEAARKAGGIAGERTLGKIKVMRGEKTLNVSFLDEYSRGRSLTAAGLRSGDIVVVPVPRDNTGGWYWFTQGLTATAQIATILGTMLTAYVTYIIIERQRD